MIELKIGRHTYQITSEDRFMDNGSCIQLLTQSKEKSVWRRRISPKLSKAAEKIVNAHKHTLHEHRYCTPVKVFSLDI